MGNPLRYAAMQHRGLALSTNYWRVDLLVTVRRTQVPTRPENHRGREFLNHDRVTETQVGVALWLMRLGCYAL